MSDNKVGCRRSIPRTLLVFLGALLGVASAYAWFLGYVEYVRGTLPYAFAFALVLLIVTAILKAKCGNTISFHEDQDHHMSPTCFSVNKYSTLVIIAAAFMLLVSLIVMATYLSLVARFIIGLIGAISVWTMLLSFVFMIYYIRLKCSC